MTWLWSIAVSLFWRLVRSAAWSLAYGWVKKKAKEWAAAFWRWS